MDLLDWEFSGFGNPGIDVATWLCVYPTDYLLPNFDAWLNTYWKAIASEGVDTVNDYDFE